MCRPWPAGRTGPAGPARGRSPVACHLHGSGTHRWRGRCAADFAGCRTPGPPPAAWGRPAAAAGNPRVVLQLPFILLLCGFVIGREGRIVRCGQGHRRVPLRCRTRAELKPVAWCVIARPTACPCSRGGSPRTWSGGHQEVSFHPKTSTSHTPHSHMNTGRGARGCPLARSCGIRAGAVTLGDLLPKGSTFSHHGLPPARA